MWIMERDSGRAVWFAKLCGCAEDCGVALLCVLSLKNSWLFLRSAPQARAGRRSGAEAPGPGLRRA